MTEEGPEFLGPMNYALKVLECLDMSASQSREAVLTAFFAGGREIDIDFIKRIAEKDYIIVEQKKKVSRKSRSLP